VTVRVGIIGCGSIARRTHAPAFTASEGAELVGFASRTRTSAEVAASECGGGPVFDDWRDLAAHADVDAVDICSPNSFHHEQAVAAAKAGKHVLVEKPIATSVDEADAMIQAAASAGVVLHVAHNLRYLAPVLAAHKTVASGSLGNVTGLRAAFGHSGPRGWAPDSTWFFDTALSGGGALIDLGIHIIDVVRFVTGLEAHEVSAMTMGAEPAEDAAQLVVRYDNGVIGSVHASWVAHPAPDMMLTILGTNGTMHFDARRGLSMRNTSGEKIEIEMPEVPGSPFEDFVRAANGEAPLGPAATGEDGRAALAIVCAAYESAQSGKTVEVR
jgi:predicted dehydrogenase